jgi:hypothetical protein
MIARTGILAGRGSSSTPLLLDTYSGAAAAYSLRKLNSSYTGSAIRVRRSSDNTESDIGFTSSGDLDESALLSFVGSGSGFVRTWYDQSGNAMDATQTTTTKQPRIVNAGVVDKQGGKPTVVFNGSSTAFSTASIPFSGDKLFIVNALYQATNQTGVVLESSANYNDNIGSFIYYVSQAYEFGLRTGATPSSGGVRSPNRILPKYSLLTALYDISQPSLASELLPRENGTAATYTYLVFTGNNTGNFTSHPVYIGAREGTSFYLNGNMPELVIWNTDQSTNRTNIENSINTHYNIY